MTSRDLITAEATNLDRIVLYREGLFWKAYERSAYALCSQVRPLKPTRKVLKTLQGGDLVSVGFPAAGGSPTLAGLDTIERTENRWVVAAPRPIDDEAFAAWKASLPVSIAIRKPVEPVEPAAAVEVLSDGLSDSGRSFSANASEGADPSDAAAAASAPVRISWLRRLRRLFHPYDASTGRGAGSSDDDTARRIVHSLKDFNLADKTPMECMLFISELKNMLVER